MNYATDTPTTHGSTFFTSLSSKVTSSGQKLGTGNPSSIEVHRRQENSSPIYGHSPTALRNANHQPSRSIGNSGYVINNKNETGLKYSSVDGFFSVTETVDSEDFLVRDNIMFKRPPYTLRPTSQNSAEKIQRDYCSQGLERNAYLDNESRVSAMSIPTSKPLQNGNGLPNKGATKITGSKKSSKVHKCNLTGVINNCNRNKMLFPYEDLVKFFQCEIWGISPRGILNCGNSCYANAVLQCLTCTKPLMVYLLRRSHSKTCRIRDWCLMCELEHHVLMLREGGGPLSPTRILSNMRNIGSRMGGGNQEDAHEFLRLLVMSMQSICLEGVGGEKEVNPILQETTLIQQIFGGRLKSKVKCLRCHLESERYEHIMDLSLEIHGWVESLEDALTQFTAPEDLDGENMYKCGSCAAYVKARKQLSVYEVPNILTIVLKRFQTGKYGKINKCVTFPEMLDMIPFVTDAADSPPLYMLYGVVVHVGTLNASFSGHYISYVKDAQGSWFKVDDSQVLAVSLNDVMSEGAYMLFYSRSFPRPPRAYIEKASAKLSAPKGQNISRHEPQKISGENSSGGSSSSILPRGETFADSLSTDFSDAASSDSSLFTSSDESSFTTESTRDSFSTVDHGETAGLDPISSIFAPPFYISEYPNNPISCTKFSTSRPLTRFFSEKKGLVKDSSSPTHPPRSVHRGRGLEQVEDPLVPGSSCNMYGRYRSNPKENFVQNSGDWGL
ncbi:ubiquitin carboxyl-terminal hydrolase 15 [Iris pallida]|uniref:Ubiquitin carboxyl-terminal hydrolase 15 n=1 Tax=Iris pallida TaxID=29817 RepID=A0AAX6GP61_IRIPA|nr:ubiquitin carboxyl-terminal hydrolase 15 [Iris pallida]